MSNKEIAPGPSSGGGQITVIVHGLQDGDQVFFRINRSSGHRFRAEQTPNDLEMEEGGEIYANLVGARSSYVETKPQSSVGGCITVKVRGTDGNIEFFRINRSTELKELMDRYCERRSVNYHSLIFIFNGGFLRGQQTPVELAMKEGDEIYAKLNQSFANFTIFVDFGKK